MKGLPPPPAGVILLQQTWQIGDSAECATTHWVLAPGVETATDAQLRAVASGWYFNVLPDFLRAVADDVTCSLLRLSTFGPERLDLQFIPAPNTGAVPGSSCPLNAAACMTWRANEHHDSHAHARLPLPNAHVSADRVHISELGYLETSNGAFDAIDHTTLIPSPGGAFCSLGVVHRRTTMGPLEVATFSPFFTGRASPYIATLDSRIRARRRVSPVT